MSRLETLLSTKKILPLLLRSTSLLTSSAVQKAALSLQVILFSVTETVRRLISTSHAAVHMKYGFLHNNATLDLQTLQIFLFFL